MSRTNTSVSNTNDNSMLSDPSGGDATRQYTATELRNILSNLSPAELAEYTREESPPGTVTVDRRARTESDSIQSSLESFQEEIDTMSRYYGAKAHVEERSGHVWKSITDCLKDQVFSFVKFWTDGDNKFLAPDFRESIDANKKEQARRICEMILSFLNRQPDLGSNYSLKLMVKFWKTYSKDIREELVRYRANATAEAKKMYIAGKSLFLYYTVNHVIIDLLY